MFSNQVSSNFPKTREDSVSNPKLQKGSGTSLRRKKPTYGKFGKKNYGDCLIRTDKCFSLGKSGQNVLYCPNLKGLNKVSGKVSGYNVDFPKKNYALRSRGEQDTSPVMVTGMLKVFLIDVYPLRDAGATLSFVNSLIAKKFDIFSDTLNDLLW